jgi:CMP-N,N'-diacetyllegionaminic acid synthase
MEEKISALIAVRSGSTRVKNKNIRNFNNASLLELKIKQLQEVKEIDEIVVNSNDTKMLGIANNLGANTVERSDYFASDTISMSEVYRNMAENIDCDIVLYANCTNPLTETKSYIDAINSFTRNKHNYDSLTSCHDIKEFLYLNNKPINYNPKDQVRSQDLPDIVALNFAISIIHRSKMIKNGNIIGVNPYFYKLDEIESVDIDTPLDFFIAKELYRKLKIEGTGLF